MAKKYLVSACLAGIPCRFDGKAKPRPEVVELYRKGLARLVCPESLSGLPRPRQPCENKDGRFVTPDGVDVTAEIEKGAEKALRVAQESGCRTAILKSRSPSCGFGRIYDGSFTKTLRPGDGAFARKLIDAGFELFDEENLPADARE